MSSNPLARHGRLSYFEIPALVPALSAAFYQQVFGWSIERRSDEDFRFSDGDGLMIGRFAMGRVVTREPGLMPFFYVDSLETALSRVTANGGDIIKPPYSEGARVRVATVRDPAGNLIGLWQFGAG